MRQALILAAIALVIGAASWAAQGPLPGDLAITQALQSAFGEAPPWAFAVTQSAVLPLVGATLAVATALAWWLRGLHGALAVGIAYGLTLASDKALRAGIFVARPSDTLVAVAAPSSSSGLPSTFGLVYGALFGVAVLTGSQMGRRAWPVRAIAAGAILIGSAARVVLGGHWTSQMIASLALGMVLAALAIRLSAWLLSLIAGKRA
jgi:membrane-associated phospholipid phosphatase